MMNILVPLVVAVVSLAAAAVALWRLLALQRRVDELTATVDDCRQQLGELAAGTATQARCLAEARADLGRLRGQLERVATGDGAQPAFDQAIRMARKGLAPSAIMATCGLSQLEADLLVLVHGGGGQQGGG